MGLNNPVGFPTAKLLKEKGFDKPTNLLYELNGTLHTVIPNSDYPHLKVHNNKKIDSYTNGFLNWNGLDLDEDERLDLYSGFNERYDDAFSVCCTAPTIADVITWLYEKHGIWIKMSSEIKGEFWYPEIEICSSNAWENDNIRTIRCSGNKKLRSCWYKSPTAAYEAAIEYTLNNLILKYE